MERFHQTLQQDLLDHVEVWPDIETAQAAVDAFRTEYNTNRPHQSLDMAFPADRFVARAADERLPLRLPSALSTTSRPAPVIAATPSPSPAVAPVVPVPPMPSTTGADPVDFAVEFTRVVPASGNLAVCGQQFWLGPDRAGATITLWADVTVVHLLVNGVRLKTVPSRLTVAHLNQLLADGGCPAGPPPIPSGDAGPRTAIEVDRLVNATGAISLAGRQHPVGYHFAGRRVTVRIDRGVLQLVADGTLLRSLPNPLTPAGLARIRDARPAGPAPVPPPEPIRVDRRVSSRGALAVAGQRIHVGIVHAGRTLAVEAADTTWRVYDDAGLIAEVPAAPRKASPDSRSTNRNSRVAGQYGSMARPKPICESRAGRFALEADPGKASTKQNVSHTAHHHRHDDQVHDWPTHAGGAVPSPTLVAAWLTLDMLPAERIPRWAAFWLVDGYDGPALVELAGLHRDDPREVRDLLPAALAECRVAAPTAHAAAAMEAFTHLAQLCVDGKAGERWIVDKVAEILSRSGYANEVIALPLGQLYDLDDEWGAGWGRTDAELHAVTRQACHDQLRLATAH